MNGRKSKLVRTIMDQIRKSPPNGWITEVVDLERKKRQHALENPVPKGMSRVFRPQYRNPARTIKNLAKSAV